MTTVELPYKLFFKVGEASFDLYLKDPKAKTPRLIGYFTSINGLIKRATQIVLANQHGTSDMIGFLKRWKEIQDELSECISKYNIE